MGEGGAEEGSSSRLGFESQAIGRRERGPSGKLSEGMGRGGGEQILSELLGVLGRAEMVVLRL